MLLLRRYPGQDILIGDNIVVKIVEVKRSTGTVLVGIEAPTDIIVDRAEDAETMRAKRAAKRMANPPTDPSST